MAKLKGLAVPYFQRSEVISGAFTEIIEAGAVINLDSDIRFLFNHTRNTIEGRNGVNLTLTETSNGIEFEIDLPNTQPANDLAERVKAGILKGVSFEFIPQEQRRDFSTDIYTRVIEKMSLLEISIVDVPCYSSTWVEVVQ